MEDLTIIDDTNYALIGGIAGGIALFVLIVIILVCVC